MITVAVPELKDEGSKTIVARSKRIEFNF